MSKKRIKKPSRDSKLCSIDLHGLRVAEALRIVDTTIDRAILADKDRVEIIHGLGSGALQRAIHTHLTSIRAVSAFRLDIANPGVTWVYL